MPGYIIKQIDSIGLAKKQNPVFVFDKQNDKFNFNDDKIDNPTEIVEIAGVNIAVMPN